MTESIFAPFVIDTEEGARKVLEVLSSEPTPWPKSNSSAHFLTKDEAAEFFRKRKENSVQETRL